MDVYVTDIQFGFKLVPSCYQRMDLFMVRIVTAGKFLGYAYIDPYIIEINDINCNIDPKVWYIIARLIKKKFITNKLLLL